MERHPLSAAFPDMDHEEFEDLLSSIKAHGQREPITVFESKVLDGWHRYRACKELDIGPMTTEFEGDDPVAFVIDLNLNRRQLSPSQKALAVVSCNAWRSVGKPVIPSRDGINCRQDDNSVKTKDLAKQAGVSTATVERAKRVSKKADKNTIEQVQKGAMTLSEALKLIDEKEPSSKRKKPVEPRLPAAVSLETYQELSKQHEALKKLYQELKDNSAELAKEIEILESIRDNEHFQKMKEMQATIDNLTQARDRWQTEAAEMKKQVLHWKKHADRKPA